jgi:uncharacterized protein YegP (UPF0339 family)
MSKIEIYRHNIPSGLWYWRLRAGNGKIVADGAEGYLTKSNAKRAAYSARGAMLRITEVVVL